MKHRVIVGLLVAVGLLSVGIGLHRMHGHCDRHRAFEQHVADLCVQAAQRTLANGASTSPKP